MEYQFDSPDFFLCSMQKEEDIKRSDIFVLFIRRAKTYKELNNSFQISLGLKNSVLHIFNCVGKVSILIINYIVGYNTLNSLQVLDPMLNKSCFLQKHL